MPRTHPPYAPSGYYAWRKRPPSIRARADAELTSRITAATSNAANTAEVSNPLAGRESGVAGVWEGSTLAASGAHSSFPSRCNAEQKVTITLLQGPNSKITGPFITQPGDELVGIEFEQDLSAAIGSQGTINRLLELVEGIDMLDGRGQ